MTRNQIEYLRLKEQQRNNLAIEELTRRRDSGTLNIRANELTEEQRHNVVTESQAAQDIGIKRTNATSQRYSAIANVTNAAANVRNAQVNAKNAETNRLNYAVNLRNAESNALNAQSQSRIADVQELNAQTNIFDAESRRMSALASQSSAAASMKQAASSAEQARIASLSQAEQMRHNAEMEKIEDLKRSSQNAVNLTQMNLNQARERQIRTGTSYAGEENARGWISTLTGAVKGAASSIVNITGR